MPAKTAIQLSHETLTLHLREPFRISRGVQTIARPVIATVTHAGETGWGEAAPSTFYGESGDTVRSLLDTLAGQLGNDPFNFQAIVERLDATVQRNAAAKAAIECALHDLAGKRLGVPVHRLLGLDATRTPLTSFTIGIDEPEVMARKARDAHAYPVLKVKVGTEADEERLAAVRDARPDAIIRVDANAAWLPRHALASIQRIEQFGIQFVEQPLRLLDPEDWRWLRSRSPLPIFADESCVNAHDVHRLAGCVDGVVVKLAKVGGLRAAIAQILAAHLHGMEVMLGCMIESAVGITAAAHLSPLVEYADLDGNLLVSDDPFEGVTVDKGKLVLPDQPGLGVRRIGAAGEQTIAGTASTLGATP